MRQVFALAERLLRDAVCFLDRLLREFMAEPVLVDGDEAEAARSEWIAEHRIHARANAWRTARDFAQHEIARLGVFDVADEQLAAFALVHGREPEPLALALDHAQHQLGRPLELLQRMGDEALALLLGSREHPIADPERAPPPALDQPKLGRRRFRMPLLGHGADLTAVIDLDHAQHRHLGHAARLMERAARRAVDQSLVGHVLEQALQIDLLLPRQPKGSRDLALARRLVGRSDEIEGLLAAGQACGALAGLIARRSGWSWLASRPWGSWCSGRSGHVSH